MARNGLVRATGNMAGGGVVWATGNLSLGMEAAGEGRAGAFPKAVRTHRLKVVMSRLGD